MSGAESGPSKKENSDFHPYQLDYVPEDLIKRANFEQYENEETRLRSLEHLRSLMKGVKTDLLWLDEDLFLLSFLRARKYNVERAFQLMKNFYDMASKYDELFKDFDFADVKKTVEENIMGFLPHRDSEGSVIYLIRLAYWNPPDISMAETVRALLCGLLHANLSPATQIAGFKIILDFAGFTWAKFIHLKISYLWLYARAVQNSFPGRFRGFHVVNQGGPLFTQIYRIMINFATTKIKDRFHFHGKNVEKLRKYFSPSILPVEYGGELPPYDNAEWRKMLEEKADYFNECFSYVYQKIKSKEEENQKRA